MKDKVKHVTQLRTVQGMLLAPRAMRKRCFCNLEAWELQVLCRTMLAMSERIGLLEDANAGLRHKLHEGGVDNGKAVAGF